MAVCNAQILEIVSGIPKYYSLHATGVTQSAEVGLSVLSLLQGDNDDGLSLIDWQMQIAGIKGGGLWADSAVGPGRTLIAAEDTNCIETMQLACRASTWTLLASRLRILARFRDLAQQFWENPRYLDPVYLKMLGVDCPGPQYALIYTMDIAVNYPDVEQQTPYADVTLTIEREPYWRGLSPGLNPKIWTLDIIKQQFYKPGSNLTLYNNQGQNDDINHALIGPTLPSGNVSNNNAGSSANSLNPNKNYVEIDATNVPGDAPALVELACQLSLAAQLNDYMIAVRTEPFSYDGMTASKFFRTTFNASNEATLGTDAATAADATTVSGNRVNITPGTATDSLRLTFVLTVPVYQGRFALFLRAYQNLGSAGDWLAHIEVNAADTFFGVGIPTIVLPEKQFSVGATHWPPVYMGEINLPLGMEAGMGSIGDGLMETSYSLLVYARRTTGTSTLRFADLIVWPLDEGSAYVSTNSDTSSRQCDVIVDNTGYIGHGKPGQYAVPINGVDNGVQYGLSEYRGPDIHLTPGKINRVYFIRTLVDTTAGIPTAGFGIRGNIIPRWRGYRDV